MRFIFDVVSYFVLFLALLGIVGGLALAGFGALVALNGDDAGGDTGVLLLWGVGAFIQGSLLALLATYCRLRIEGSEQPR